MGTFAIRSAIGSTARPHTGRDEGGQRGTPVQESPTDELAPVAQWCSGPTHRLYAACYVVRHAQGYVGYAKICTRRPKCPWSTGSEVAKVGTAGFATVQQAIDGLNWKVGRLLAMRHQRLVARLFDLVR